MLASNGHHRINTSQQPQIAHHRQIAWRGNRAGVRSDVGGRYRLAKVVDIANDAIGWLGRVFDIRLLDQIAVHCDRTQPVVIMRAAAGPLIGVKRDHRVVHHPVAIGVAIGDRGNLRGVAFDHDPVALGAGIVGDHVIAHRVDPMVVQLVILTGNAAPVDGAVVIGVFLDIARLGVDQRLEIEDIRACATGQHVVAGDRLVRVELAIGQLAQRITFVAVGIKEDRRLAGIGA